MKKVLILSILVLLITSLFVGCNLKEKAVEKAGEKLTEKFLEGAMGGDGKVDVSSGGVTIKDKDGNETTIGETTWPTSKTADLLPKCKKGKVVGVLNSTNNCLITLQEIEQSDFEAYIEEVKGAGYTVEVTELDVDGTKSYFAKKDEKTSISVIFNSKEKGMVITLGIQE